MPGTALPWIRKPTRAWARTAAERRLGVVKHRRRAKGRDGRHWVCVREAVRDEVRGQEAECERI
jgi:hypothetical protein